MQSSADVFPPTLKTWIERKNGEGKPGRDEINRYIMSVYAWPLKVFFLGSRERRIGEPDEVVNEFFKSRLGRAEFFSDWLASGKRLRKWLINGFCFHLRELRSGAAKAKRFGPLKDDDAVEIEPEAYRQAHNAFVVSLMRQAMAEAAAECQARGLLEHWNLFVRHTVDKRPFDALSEEFGVTAAQAAVRNRTAEKYLKNAVRSLLERDGIPPHRIDDEIRLLLEESKS